MHLCFTFLFSCCSLSFLHGQQWSQLVDFPGDGRDDGTSFIIGNTAYCGTGVTASFEVQRDFYAFNMESQTWLSGVAMPEGQQRQYAVGFAHQNLGYIFGGINSSEFLTDLWVFDPNNGNWTNKTSLPGEGRSGASGFVLNGKAFIIGGKNQNTEGLNEVWAYDFAADTWAQKGDLPFGGRWRANTVAISGKAYLLFGRDETGRFCNEMYEYDADADEWIFIGLFPGLGRNYVDAQVIDNKIYCFGGNDTLGTFYNDFWRYDPITTLWEALAALPGEARRAGMTFTNGQVYFYSSGLSSSIVRIKETWKADQLTAVKEINTKQNIKIYPNPAKEYVRVALNSASSNLKIELIDQFGRVCLTQHLNANDNVINLSSLSSGLYFVRIDHRTVEKLLKY